MIITKRLVPSIGLLAFLFTFLLLPATQQAAAITSYTRPTNLNCDPLPTDIDLLDECIYWQSVDPAVATQPVAGSPTNPYTNTGITGTYGLSGAYNSFNNTYLVVGNELQGGVGMLFGTILDANTNQVVVPKFRIDMGTAFAGDPLAVYNPQTKQYFVAWEDSRRGDKYRDNYARIINADGTFAGNDFLVSTDGFLDDVDYDARYNRYVVVSNPGAISFKTVDSTGVVSAPVNLNLNGNDYDGQGSLAINTTLNEYWITYVSSTPIPNCTGRCEDNRIMLVRVDASTLAMVGTPILVSTPKPKELIGMPSVAYDPITGAVLVTWMDWSNSGIMSRLVYDDGTLGTEKQLLTPMTDTTSDFYGSPIVSYNSTTNTFFLSALDNNGGTMLVELSGDTVLEVSQPIAPLTDTSFKGQFWPTHIDTGSGAIALSSRNYSAITLGTSQSPTYTPPPIVTPVPPLPPSAKFDPKTVGEAISQMYMYALGAAGLLAMIMIIIGGYYVMTSSGNAAQATKGKEFIYSSLIGLAILLASYLILTTLNPDLVSFDLTTFKNPILK